MNESLAGFGCIADVATMTVVRIRATMPCNAPAPMATIEALAPLHLLGNGLEFATTDYAQTAFDLLVRGAFRRTMDLCARPVACKCLATNMADALLLMPHLAEVTSLNMCLMVAGRTQRYAVGKIIDQFWAAIPWYQVVRFYTAARLTASLACRMVACLYCMRPFLMSRMVRLGPATIKPFVKKTLALAGMPQYEPRPSLPLPVEINWFSATTGAKRGGRAIIGEHAEPPIQCATPSAAMNSAGAFACPHYSTIAFQSDKSDPVIASEAPAFNARVLAHLKLMLDTPA